MPPIIQVENLGKCYRLHHESRERYTALRDVIARKAGSFLEKLKLGKQKAETFEGEAQDKFQLSQFPISAFPAAPAAEEDFWALKDVSFEVKPGEVVGIIGRNGAGKSTLLKILSRITEPTTGRITLRGRVASLLEVGTGFHPELTGRENIYLNGAILGMTKVEIKSKFDEIVAFAEIEKFLDTPVKRYSSGMYVRLAFAVAAHLEPEILIVDEVLAVGDAEFQNKCLGKMEGVARNEGRTVIFVSHDMRKMTALCKHGILLNAGRVELAGSMSEVANAYIGSQCRDAPVVDLSSRSDRSGNKEASFKSIALLKSGMPAVSFDCGDAITFRITLDVIKRAGASMVAVLITTADAIPVHEMRHAMGGGTWDAALGLHEFQITVPKLGLYPGVYAIDLWLGNAGHERVDYVTRAATLSVVQSFSSGVKYTLDRANGLVSIEAIWEHRHLEH
ncbi:ABC transporter ATP-binding protein [Prosthecobacter sp.]|uniref:ABC transporter ATP-binding protein n=1 Tax=Prosthecobacter sp. TaxID=1965333 RepID=UPI002AB9FAA8|nr:ABC transporter ATP-binding protein [Prosthecobacter sp.]MDZ4401101.1 ABC transporter ATP-binding protein [Prosthecobacter sp.]